MYTNTKIDRAYVICFIYSTVNKFYMSISVGYSTPLPENVFLLLNCPDAIFLQIFSNMYILLVVAIEFLKWIVIIFFRELNCINFELVL